MHAALSWQLTHHHGNGAEEGLEVVRQLTAACTVQQSDPVKMAAHTMVLRCSSQRMRVCKQQR